MQISWYLHQSGANVGTMRLQISKDGGAYTDLWSLSGQNNTPETANYTMYSYDLGAGGDLAGVTNYSLRFRYEWLTSFDGDAALDRIHVWNSGAAPPAPPSGTGGGVAMACDTCHEFAPNDDALDGSGHPTNPASTEYTYRSAGDHQKHGVGDTGTPANPAAADASGVCDKCHPAGVTSYTNAHSNGSVELRSGTIGRSDGSDNGTWNSGAKTCANVDCHFNATTPAWGSGTTNCGSCHQYPPTTQAGAVDHDANLTVAPATLANFLSAHTDCEVCHGARSSDGTVNGTFTAHANYPAGSHADGLIRMNGPDATPGPAAGTEYDDSNGGCNKACHANDATYRMATSATRTVNYADFGAGTCDACHAAGKSGDIVTDASPHLSLTRGGPAQPCTACHPGNTRGGFHSKSGDANVVAIPNYANVGIDYPHTVDTGINGIVLGGDNTTGTTEAEICWNCHDANGNGVLDGTEPSEWGTNTDTNGTAANYNFGTLSTKSWFTGTWTSATYSYKTGLLTSKPTLPAATPGSAANGGSTHTANPSGAPWNGPTGPGVDTVAQVRCSYCHDVHNTAGTKFTALGQAAKAANDPSGAPFIRGSWRGNPYKEDGAPRAGDVFPNLNTYGPVPRPTTAASTVAGYYIDQNTTTGTPTSLNWTADEYGGLCELCHAATSNGAWTTAELDSINTFGTSGTDWGAGRAAANNGHAAVVRGGGNTAAAVFNLYRESRRHPIAGYPTYESVTSSNGNRGQPLMGYKHVSGTSVVQYALRTTSSNLGGSPRMSSGRPYAYQYFNWGVTMDDTTNQTDYHAFSCSKCHTPHASRLPRLMITNCLDTKVNTWDDGYADTTNTQLSAENMSVKTSQYTSAVNCHRRRDPAEGKTWTGMTNYEDGWNSLTPWQ
jgi:predicted CxxxxCH...CXXCH cytochrome family protein